MKIALILFFLTFFAFSQPDIGFLRIYNLMSPNETFTPFLNSKQLTKKPMKPGDDVSGIYFKVGTYSLRLDSNDFTLLPINLKIEKNQTTSIIVLPIFNKRSGAFEPRLIILSKNFKQELPKGVLPLKLLSFSKDNLYLQCSFGEVFIPIMGSKHYDKWKGTPFSLKIGDQKLGFFEPEGSVAHTLILWDKGENHKQAAFIPNTQYSPPAGLRDDLTFGKKKEAFKTLKKLPSRQ